MIMHARRRLYTLNVPRGRIFAIIIYTAAGAKFIRLFGSPLRKFAVNAKSPDAREIVLVYSSVCKDGYTQTRANLEFTC